jgi:rhodanese-related sulfurtransferase
MRVVHVTAIGVWLANGGVVLGRQSSSEPASVARLEMDEFRKLHTAGSVLVVDVRDELVFKAGHSPGAVSVPLAEIERRVADVRERARDRPIVTYCSCPSEQTALSAAIAFWKRGVINVSVLVGGYPEWVAAGGAVQKGAG